jgi:TRAP-type C4-dicarboxylate transport system permease small subunit
MVVLSVKLSLFVAGTGQLSPTLGIPAYVIYVAPAVGFASLAFGYVLRLFGVRDSRTKTASGEWLGGEQQL